MKLSYDNAFADFDRSGLVKTLRLIPLIMALAACSSVDVPISPYRIDVQQGNALEQDTVDKLKPGMTAAQVRFLLGTPLLVDPFHKDRWDYVYNFRKAGKLIEQRRLTLLFSGESLVRIEPEGFPPRVAPEAATQVAETKPQSKPTVAATPAVAAPAKPVEKPVQEQAAMPAPVATQVAPVQTATVQTTQSAPAQPAMTQSPAKAPVTAPVAAATTPATPAAVAVSASKSRSLDETSVVKPLVTAPASKPVPAPAQSKQARAVALQTETNVAAVKPETVPTFPEPAKGPTVEEQVKGAVNAWKTAWQNGDIDAYLAAYAASFQPADGSKRAEWEKRRRYLLGYSRNINLRIDGEAFESITEDRAQISFRQFYRSDTYQDAVIKQLKLVRVDNLWLIEEERVLAPIKVDQ